MEQADEWSKLTDLLRDRVRDDEAILASGVSRVNDSGRWYDFYRGRVTFPIRDSQGRIVGFGARLLDPNAKAQKYINSPEGPLFSKSKLLYALDRLAASRRLKQDGRALIMEGYTDVIAAHEAGFDNAVAPLGTALTAEQVQLLRRYGSGVTLVLDGDAAGISGAERGLNIVLEAGADATVAVIPGGMDPFDLLRAQGAEAFERVIKSQRDAFDFKLEMVRSRYNLARPAEVTGALEELAAVLARVEDERLRSRYVSYAATALKLRESQVTLAVNEALAELRRRDERAQSRTATDAPPRSKTAAAGPGGARLIYERRLMARLMDLPQTLPAAGELLEPAVLANEGLRELFVALLNSFDEHGSVVPGALYAHLGEAGRMELEETLKLTQAQGAGKPGVPQEAERESLLEELRRLAVGHGESGGRTSLEALRKRKSAGKRAGRRP